MDEEGNEIVDNEIENAEPIEDDAGASSEDFAYDDRNGQADDGESQSDDDQNQYEEYTPPRRTRSSYNSGRAKRGRNLNKARKISQSTNTSRKEKTADLKNDATERIKAETERKMAEETRRKMTEEVTEKAAEETAKKSAEIATEAAAKSAVEGATTTASTGASAGLFAGCGFGCAIIVVIMLLIGLISFIFNMPDSVIGKITEWWDDTWRGSKVYWSGSISEALAEERVESTAQYLENMGFDLAGYGFLDNLEEEENVEYRYFTIYLTSAGFIDSEGKQVPIEESNIWGGSGDSGIPISYLEEIFGLKKSGNTGKLLIKFVDQSFVEKLFDATKRYEMTFRVKIVVDGSGSKKLDTKEKNILCVMEKDEAGNILAVDSRTLLSYLAAEERTYMFKGQWANFTEWWNGSWLKNNFEKIFRLGKKEEKSKDEREGMLKLDETVLDSYDKFKGYKFKTEGKNADGEKVSIYEDLALNIDREQRSLNVPISMWTNGKTKDSSGYDQDLPIYFGEYRHDLVGWTGKYGKPIEFSLAMHLATMSPDFTNEFVTNEDIETEVDIKFAQIPYSRRLLKDGEDAQSMEASRLQEQLDTRIAEIEAAEEELKKLEAELEQLKNIVDNIINSGGNFDNRLNDPSLTMSERSEIQSERDSYNSRLSDAISRKNSKEAEVEEFRNTWGTYIEAINNEEVQGNISLFSSIINQDLLSKDEREDVKSLAGYLNSNLGTSLNVNTFCKICTYNDTYGNKNINLPYISKVSNHWYRNLEFGEIKIESNMQVGDGGTKEENAWLIWQFLISKGFTEEGAAGMLGNIEAECDLIPYNNEGNKKDDKQYTADVDSGKVSRSSFVYNKEGYGLAQWTYWSRKAKLYDYMKGHNYSIGSLQGQLEFMVDKELVHYKSLFKKLKTTTSVTDASDAIDLIYERPASVIKGGAARQKSLETRREYAKKWYKKFHGKSFSTTDTSTSTETTETTTETSTGTVSAPNFKKYNLTDDQILIIANMCVQEQGASKEGVAAEASLMCNVYEIKKIKNKSLFEWVTYTEKGHWFGKSTLNKMHSGEGKPYVDIVKQVICDGKRTLPGYIDEHDMFADIKSASGVSNKTDRSQYKKDVTIIKNIYGAIYTFYCFPTSKSDPFGYDVAGKALKNKIGEGCYDINGNPINGVGGSAGENSTQQFGVYIIDYSAGETYETDLITSQNIIGNGINTKVSELDGIELDPKDYTVQVSIEYGIKQISEPKVYDNSKKVKELLGFVDENLFNVYKEGGELDDTIESQEETEAEEENTEESETTETEKTLTARQKELLNKLQITYKDKYKYYTYDGEGRSAEKQNIDLSKNMLIAMTMLENTHTEDAAHILTEFKELYNDLGIELEQEEDITTTEKSNALTWIFKNYIPNYDWPAADEIPITEDANSNGKLYTYIIKNNSNTNKNEKVKQVGEEPVSTVAIPRIGFEGTQELVAPGNCEVVNIGSNSITIKFQDILKTETKQVRKWNEKEKQYEITEEEVLSYDNEIEGMTLYIHNINIKSDIKVGTKLNKEDTLGTTLENKDLELLLRKRDNSIANLSQYIYPPDLSEIELDTDNLKSTPKTVWETYQAQIAEMSVRYGVDPYLVLAIISANGNNSSNLMNANISKGSVVLTDVNGSSSKVITSSGDIDTKDEDAIKADVSLQIEIGCDELRKNILNKNYNIAEALSKNWSKIVNQIKNIGDIEEFWTIVKEGDNYYKVCTNISQKAVTRIAKVNWPPKWNIILNIGGANSEYSTGPGGNGYSKTISIGGRTYKIYKQGRYSTQWKGMTIAAGGCGPTALAIVASGYGKDVNPIGASKLMSERSLSAIASALNKLGIKHSSPKYVNSASAKDQAIREIRENFAAGRPVIVLVGRSKRGSNPSRYTGGGHFMVLFGEKDGKLIIGQPSGKSETGELEDFVTNYMLYSVRSNRGYILIQE